MATRDYFLLQLPGWKGLHKACTACDEIVHLRAHHIRVLLARPQHAILHSLHARRPMLASHTSQYISPSLYRASSGSATCNTENSMFFTPVSTHVARAIITCGEACITRNFPVFWCLNFTNFQQIFTNSAGKVRTFPPGQSFEQHRSVLWL